MDSITAKDLLFINDMTSRRYTGNTILSNATPQENEYLSFIRKKLKSVAEYFAFKYENDYGPFNVDRSRGNPIRIGGDTLNRVWAGFYKGNNNKQYSAQISFVIHPYEPCLEVGFYFGRASAHKIKPNERKVWEERLRRIGKTLSQSIRNYDIYREYYEKLFEYGFNAYSKGSAVSPDEWCDIISENAVNSHIYYKIHPKENGEINNSTLDTY
ncbi:MAG: hypothetical protein LUD76_11465, partial [Alistipes sp.]|nr:hypothetical protein [Alistipes sp.]